MRNSTFGLLLLLVPTAALAQGTVAVSSVVGSVEWRPVTAARFAPLPVSTQMVHVGDQIHTGAGANLILTLPDTSYIVISENSTVTIQEFWAGSTRNLVDVVVGKVRFYIQRLGGKPNPYRVQTPTALIAVRGTTFEVASYAKQTEVSCLEGRVAVETVGLPDREVILEAGMHTLVYAGAPPVIPVALNESLIKNRVLQVVRKDGEDAVLTAKTAAAIDRQIRDNDRMNRTTDSLPGSNSSITTDTQRAKPATLRYPPE
jgi:hypothetical protein